MAEPAHGTSARYQAGCRCADCAAAYAAYHLAWRHGQHVIRPEQHGTQYAYTNLRCRCDDCKAAHSAATSAWRASKREASR